MKSTTKPVLPSSCLFLALPSPSPWPALHSALDFRCDPTTVEISFLRLYLLSINVTVPRPCVEAQMVFDWLYPAGWGNQHSTSCKKKYTDRNILATEGKAETYLETLGRSFVTPHPILDKFTTLWVFQGPICSFALPFAKRTVRGGDEWNRQCGWREIVCFT